MRDLVAMSTAALEGILPGMAVAYRSMEMGAFEVVLASAKRRETAFVAGIALPRSSDMGGNITVATDGTVDLTTEQWDAVTGRTGGLVSQGLVARHAPGHPVVPVNIDFGAIYYLADEPGRLSPHRPGNWRVPVGVAIGAGVLRLRIGNPELRLTDRVVESAWLRSSDRTAVALVFADGEQQIFDVVSTTFLDTQMDDGTDSLVPPPAITSIEGVYTAGTRFRGPLESLTELGFVINRHEIRLQLSGPGRIKPRTSGLLTLDGQSWTEL